MSHEPKKLALVITELEVGGAERCLVNLARGIDQGRFQPTVYSIAPRPSAPRDALVGLLESAHIPVRFLGFTRKWRFPAAVGQLVQAWREQPPDVVQSMLFHANVVTGLAVRRLGRCDSWCAGIRVADPSRTRQMLERSIVKQASHVVCVSQRVADYAGRRMAISVEQLAVIPNGIDVDAGPQQAAALLESLGVPPLRRSIICVSRLDPQKGVDQLLQSAADWLGALPMHDLLIVGDGSQAVRLRRMAAHLDIAARVHFCGWQPNVLEILRASDLLVLPSRWEGMPNVLLEAMACERPVVCTQAEGVMEVLGPLSVEQSVPVGDIQGFTQKVLNILKQPSLAAELGKNNRQRVATHFSLKGMVQRYEALFERVSRGLSNREKPL